MPRGVYPRTANQLRAAKANLAKGREPKARAKAAKTLKKIAEDEEWREKVSKATKKAMYRPDVRRRHLKGLARALERYGPNFKGGKGHGPTDEEREAGNILMPLGFIPEFKILTAGHRTKWNPPGYYHADFAHPVNKIVIELDGICHHNQNQKVKDKKKTEVLEALGWTVFRLSHD